MNYLMPNSFANPAKLAQVARVLIAPVMLLGVVAAQAQVIYRCPSNNGITQYTNDKAEADRMGCAPITGGNVTVVQNTPRAVPAASPGVRLASVTPAIGGKSEGPEQRVRDSDTRAILDAELKKAEIKQTGMLLEFNNGEPEKRADESRNHQRYLDRVAELKANIARNDSDIAGIKREIARLPAIKN